MRWGERMKAKPAWKLGILAIVAFGFLSGCYIANSATIEFDNTVNDTFDCYVDGDYAVTVGPFGIAYYDVTWAGARTTTFFVEVYDTIGFYDSLDVIVTDGQLATVEIF